MMRNVIAAPTIVKILTAGLLITGGCTWLSSSDDAHHLEQARQAQQAERIGEARIHAEMAVDAGVHQSQAEEILAAASRYRADESYEAGHFRRAHAAYLEAAEYEPSTMRRANDLHRAYRAASQAGLDDDTLYELALDAVELRGDDTQLRRDIARLAEDRADYETAIDHYLWLFSADSTDTDVGLRLGISYLAVDQPVDAIAVLRRVREQAPDNVQAAVNLARAYIDNDRLDDADRLYQQLLEDIPDHPAILRHYAVLKQRLGEHDEARRLRQKAADASPAVEEREMRPLQ